MLSSEQVLDQYKKALDSISSQDAFKKILRIMAMHPYTDFANCALIMQNNINVGIYSTPGKAENGEMTTGFVFNPKTSKMGIFDITYFDVPGPAFNREIFEAAFEFDSTEYDSDGLDIKENGTDVIILYPESWSEQQKTEAFFGIIYDMYEKDTSFLRNCVLYMLMIYAGYNAYLPSSTFNEANTYDCGLTSTLTYISAHYQAIFRRIFGLYLTPLEVGMVNNYQSYSKIEDKMVLIYKESYEHLLGEKYREPFKMDLAYYPLEPLDYLLD